MFKRYLYLGVIILGLNGTVAGVIYGLALNTAPAQASVIREHHPAVLGQDVSLVEMRDLVKDKNNVLVVDARHQQDYMNAHLPEAINLPQDDFEQAYFYDRLLVETHKNKPIVVYCASLTCPAAESVADELLKRGYQNVRVFRTGYADWHHAHLPEDDGRDE